MTIGKASEAPTSTARLTDPIGISLKLGRAGLGHDADEKEKQQERVEAHMKKMQADAKISVSPNLPVGGAIHLRRLFQDILATDFRKRKRDNAIQRTIIADIMKSRKACQEMDLR